MSGVFVFLVKSVVRVFIFRVCCVCVVVYYIVLGGVFWCCVWCCCRFKCS